MALLFGQEFQSRIKLLDFLRGNILIILTLHLPKILSNRHTVSYPEKTLPPTYTLINCLFGKIFSRFWTFLMRKQSLAGFGLLASTLTMPAGNESIMSPDILTWHLDSSLPLKWQWSWIKNFSKNFFWNSLEERVNNFMEGDGEWNGVTHADGERRRSPRTEANSGCSEL